jgi:type I restriction enzyme S subunit
LGDISSMSSGGTPLTHVSEYYNGNINWVSISDMTLSGKYISNTLRKITNKGLQNSSARLFPVNTILLAMYASIGKCCIATDLVSTSQAILGITTSERLNEEFLYYFLYFNREKIANQGQQGTQSNLNKSMVEDVKLWIPKIQEQNAVVDVLADIDNEIQILEEKKQKGSMLKQGMMQELLTGKTRII